MKLNDTIIALIEYSQARLKRTTSGGLKSDPSAIIAVHGTSQKPTYCSRSLGRFRPGFSSCGLFAGALCGYGCVPICVGFLLRGFVESCVFEAWCVQCKGSDRNVRNCVCEVCFFDSFGMLWKISWWIIIGGNFIRFVENCKYLFRHIYIQSSPSVFRQRFTWFYFVRSCNFSCFLSPSLLPFTRILNFFATKFLFGTFNTNYSDTISYHFVNSIIISNLLVIHCRKRSYKALNGLIRKHLTWKID